MISIHSSSARASRADTREVITELYRSSYATLSFPLFGLLHFSFLLRPFLCGSGFGFVSLLGCLYFLCLSLPLALFTTFYFSIIHSSTLVTYYTSSHQLPRTFQQLPPVTMPTNSRQPRKGPPTATESPVQQNSDCQKPSAILSTATSR